MSETVRVAVDAMGGDNAPGEIVKGAVQAVQAEKDIKVFLVGRQDAVNAELAKYTYDKEKIEVVMTREKDEMLSEDSGEKTKIGDMKMRVEKINKEKPLLTVSIHQNSYHQEEVSGGQVFYYKSSEKGKRLAEIIQKRFDYVLGEQNRRLARANGNYYLLLHVKCPIVIVECGFLSNRKEAALLQDPEYQDRMAWTVHMGIMEYLGGSA